MRIFSSILFITILQLSGIIMPFYNFNDDAIVHRVYDGLQREDPDLNLGEFIFEKLLVIGRLIDHDDEEEEHPPLSSKTPASHLPVQIQQGTIIFNAVEFIPGKKASPSIKPTCSFIQDNYAYNYLPCIFHPPLRVC